MGRIQKLKKQRKIEREKENLLKKKKKNRLFKISGLVILVFFLVVGGAKFFFKEPVENLESNLESTSQEIVGEKIAVLETNLGTIKFKFFTEEAPKTVANFKKLAEEKFYDGIKFHRVIKNFMIQTGDPNSRDDDWSDDGRGGPGYKFEDEINENKLVRGMVAMANSGPDTNGSQFFIVSAEETPWLDGRHTVFGQVIEGMEIVDQIEDIETNENDHPLKEIVMSQVYLEKE